MKKLKFLLACLLIMSFILSTMSIPVFASPCCLIGIENITQENGIITVDYWSINPLPNREVRLEIETADNNYIRVYETTFYISSNSDENVPFTFDGSFLLDGCTYELSIGYTYCCENYYCSTDRDSEEFTVEDGIPFFEFEDLPNGMLELVGESKAAVRLTASEEAIYNFSTIADDVLDIRSYPDDHRVREGYSKFDKNESRIYVISTYDESDLSAEINFGLAQINEAECKTDNPSDNDVCFEISDYNGLNKIKIPVEGLYSFELTDTDTNSSFHLLDESYVNLNIGFSDASLNQLLNAGTYYIDTTYLSEEYSLSVKYVVPESIEFDKVYTPEYNEAAPVRYYYKFDIASPSVLKISNPSQIFCGILIDGHLQYFYGEGDTILTEGTYYLYLESRSSDEEGISFKAESFESIGLNNAYTPQISVYGSYYFAFCAPEDGKYEFDFTSYSGYYWFDNDNQNSSNMKYYTMELKKDEWVLIGMYNQAEVTVREYEAPTAQTISFEETVSFDFLSGKTYLYKFTPDKDDLYKIYTEYTYCKNIKIWTDSEVLYETAENNYYSLNMNFELKKDVPVYISFSGEGDNYGEKSTLTVKSPFEVISENATVTMDNSADVMVCYQAKESGYHNINFSRGYASSTSVIVTVKGKEYYVFNNKTRDVVVYLEKDETLFITFEKFNDSWLPEVNISITAIEVKDLTAGTGYVPQIGEVISFTPESDSVYKLTFPKELDVQISSDKADYIAMGERNDLYFVGLKGEKYVITVSENTWNTDGYAEYSDLCITKLDSRSIDINKPVTTTEEFEVLTFNIPETGLYRIENDLCNTRLDIFFDGQWSMISGTYTSLFRLEKGNNFIISASKNYFDSIKIPGLDTPCARFSIKPATDTNKIGISLEDAYFSPVWGPRLRFCVTSPYDVCDFNIGIEYKDENGVTVQKNIGYEAMYASDKRYTECDLYGLNWGEGTSVTIRPYVFTDNNEDEIIYGEEKTVTFALTEDIIPLEYRTTTTKLKSQDDYNYYRKDYYYKFTQPENATGKTYIEYSDSIEYPELFNSDYARVNTLVDNEGNAYYELTPGEEYYFIFSSYFDDSDAEITISSLPLPEMGEEAFADVSVSGNAISFVVAPNEIENDTIYVAVYDDNNSLSEILCVENPEGAYGMPIKNLGTGNVKVMYFGKEALKPLCDFKKIPLN